MSAARFIFDCMSSTPARKRPRRAPRAISFDDTHGAELLRERGVYFRELAELLDVSAVSARAYIRGATLPNEERILRIKQRYGIPETAWYRVSDFELRRRRELEDATAHTAPARTVLPSAAALQSRRSAYD
jgi:transcriptional regulator with XRE-family HTH domain